MRAVRKRVADRRFLSLLWKLLKAGYVDRGLFRAASEGVPQGGVLTPRTQKRTSSSIAW
jgi:RNA-directed DNA polymerase